MGARKLQAGVLLALAAASALVASCRVGSGTGTARPPDLFVEEGATGTTGSHDDPFGTIQQAIDAADPGDIISAAAGTYVEDLVITKRVTLQGESRHTTVIKGVAVVPAASWPLAAPNIDIRADRVRIHGFTIESPAVGAAEYSSGIVLTGTDIEIYACIFVVATGDVSQAIQTYAGNNAPPGLRDISGLYIHDNTFTHLTPLPGGSDQYEGIYINPQTDPASETDPVVIEYNTFSGELLRAVTTERSRTVIQDNSLATDAGALIAGYPLGILVRSSAAQDHVTVRYNRIDDSGAATFGRGVVIGSAGQAMDAIVAHSNVISDCGTAGIVVGCDLSADDDVIVSDNSITDNAAGLDFTGAAGSWTVDAEFNWWGAGDGPSGAGPGSGDSVSADVDFSPWLTGPP